MNTMNMPGFTAEASFYETSRSYRGTRSQPAGGAASTIVAQSCASAIPCANPLARRGVVHRARGAAAAVRVGGAMTYASVRASPARDRDHWMDVASQ
jgi:hypothetical protein